MSVNLLNALILSSSCEVVSGVQTKTLGSAAPDLHRKKMHLLPPHEPLRSRANKKHRL